MAQSPCTRCNGTGYANAAHDAGKEDLPLMLQPVGVYICSTCNGGGKVGLPDEVIESIKLLVKSESKKMSEENKDLTENEIIDQKLEVFIIKCFDIQIKRMYPNATDEEVHTVSVCVEKAMQEVPSIGQSPKLSEALKVISGNDQMIYEALYILDKFAMNVMGAIAHAGEGIVAGTYTPETFFKG